MSELFKVGETIIAISTFHSERNHGINDEMIELSQNKTPMIISRVSSSIIAEGWMWDRRDLRKYACEPSFDMAVYKEPEIFNIEKIDC